MRLLDALSQIVEHPDEPQLCPDCGGTGGKDTGGVTPWGTHITDACPSCKGEGWAAK